MAKAQMTAALNHGISWGMGEDAGSDDEEGGPPTVEWRAYAQTHSLTDHQQKLAEKVRRLENRIRNLTTEAERIRVRHLACSVAHIILEASQLYMSASPVYI